MIPTSTRPDSHRAPVFAEDLYPPHSRAMNSANSKSSGGAKLGSSAMNLVLIVVALIAVGAVLTLALRGPGDLGDLIGKVTGKSQSAPAGAIASGTGTPSADPSTLTIATPGSMDSYKRSDFGAAWTDDVDVEGGHNGCATRDDILRRDLTGVTLSGKCTVVSGTLADPYTGRVISFTRGKDTSGAVQIDHIVALGNVWVSGAYSWKKGDANLKRIANDPINLIAADGPANMGKKDKSADKWLPANPAFQCTYVKYQVMVKNKYRLTVTAPEKAVMQKFAGRC